MKPLTPGSGSRKGSCRSATRSISRGKRTPTTTITWDCALSSGSVRKAGSLLALMLIAAYALFAGPAMTAAAAPVSAEGSGAEGSASPGGRKPEIVFQGNAEKSDAVLRRAAAQALAEFEKTQRPADIDDA